MLMLAATSRVWFDLPVVEAITERFSAQGSPTYSHNIDSTSHRLKLELNVKLNEATSGNLQ
jgi:hypothetical protein